jgi:hypothetical protein
MAWDDIGPDIQQIIMQMTAEMNEILRFRRFYRQILGNLLYISTIF